MKRKIDRRRHVVPMKCLGCGEEKIKGESNLVYSGMTDSITYDGTAYCWDCMKVSRMSEVLSNFVSLYDMNGNRIALDDIEKEEVKQYRERVRRIIVGKLCDNKELREYLGMNLDREISVEALVKKEDDLAERVRHTKEWELKNEESKT